MIALGAPFITDINIEPPTIPAEPSAWDYLAYPIANIGFFFSLMLASQPIGFLGIILFAPPIFVLIYGLLKLLRGGG